MHKKVVNAINFLRTQCEGQNLKSTRTVKTDDDKVYFEFVCLDCNATNTIELMSILTSLYTVPFAPESKLIH